MHKKALFFVFIILLKVSIIECAQKSSHYQLQVHEISLQRPPVKESVEPIISCTIKPSLMEIKHGEMYYLDNNRKQLHIVISTVLLRDGDYDNLKKYLERSKIVYVESHNPSRTYWIWFKIDPQRAQWNKANKKAL